MNEARKRPFGQLLFSLKDFGGCISVHNLLAAEVALADENWDNHGVIANALHLVDVSQAVLVHIPADRTLKTLNGLFDVHAFLSPRYVEEVVANTPQYIII